MNIKKLHRCFIIVAAIGLLCACAREEIPKNSPGGADTISTESSGKQMQQEQQEQWNKGYDRPDREREAAERDCKAAMELTWEIYSQADKGDASNVVISDSTILQMKEKVKSIRNPVTGSEMYTVMENYEEMENFLLNAQHGKTGEVTLFQVHGNGGIGKFKFTYDGRALCIWGTKF